MFAATIEGKKRSLVGQRDPTGALPSSILVQATALCRAALLLYMHEPAERTERRVARGREYTLDEQPPTG